EPGRVSTEAINGAISGWITLGDPVRRGAHFAIPVIVAASPDSEVPQALSLRVVFSGGAVRNPVIRHAADIRPSFEISRRTANALTYLVMFDGGARRAIVAEIELDVDATANVSVDVDPALTLLSNIAGTRRATVAAGTLQV